MSKAEIYEKISDYIDGTMSDNELKEFELKINTNNTIREEIDDIRDLIKNIKGTQSLKLPNDFNSKLEDAIDSSKSSEFSVFKLFDNPVWATAGSVAAAILLVVTVTIFFSETQKNNFINNESEVAFDENSENLEESELFNLHQANTEKKEVFD